MGDIKQNTLASTGTYKRELLIGGAVGGYLALGGLVWATGWIAAKISSAKTPQYNLITAPFEAIDSYPGVNKYLHWGTALVLFAVVGVLAGWMWRRKHGAFTIESKRRKFESRHGWAKSGEIKHAASKRTLQKSMPQLLPHTHKTAKIEDAGYRLGLSRGIEIWGSIERSYLVVGPPGSGKGVNIVVPMLMDHRGPCITTSTKPDNVRMTIGYRAMIGPVGVFDPQGLAPGIGHRVAWDIIAGCEYPERAGARAGALAANSKISSSGQNAEWRQQAKNMIECLLHAAGVARAATGDVEATSIRRVYEWSQSISGLEEAVRILREHSDHPGCRNPDFPTEAVVCGWAARLQGMLEDRGGTGKTALSSVMSVVASSLSPLGYPSVLAALTPSSARPAIDSTRLLADNGTIYCLASDKSGIDAAGFVSALIEDVAYAARLQAARLGGRMEPNILFALDECANVCSTIPSLPQLLSDGRGQNLTVMPVFQSLSQVRSAYGNDDAATVFSASTIKIIMGGQDEASYARDLSDLIGYRDEIVHSSSQSAHTMLFDANASTSTSLRKEPILPPDQIRAIPQGSAVVLQSATAPYPLRMRPWWDHPLASEVKASLEATKAAELPHGLVA